MNNIKVCTNYESLIQFEIKFNSHSGVVIYINYKRKDFING